jgi:hypothetical protein
METGQKGKQPGQFTLLLAKSLKTLERVKGIEPSSSAWKAVALPLSYTRIGFGGEVGLEPAKA